MNPVVHLEGPQLEGPPFFKRSWVLKEGASRLRCKDLLTMMLANPVFKLTFFMVIERSLHL